MPSGARMLSEPSRMNTARVAIASPVEMPTDAIAAAAAIVSARFFGLRPDKTAPATNALPVLNVSIACIHSGIDASSLPRGRPRHVGAARRTKATPKTSLTMVTQVAGPSPSSSARPLANASMSPPAIESPINQPTAKAGPFVLARGVPSMDDRDDRDRAERDADSHREDVTDCRSHQLSPAPR